MQVHFVHRHVHDTVLMLEEGNLPLPRCPWCDLQVSRKALNGRHLGTIQCRTGTERKRRRLAEAEMQENSERAFHAYGKPMEAVSDFRYLGRLLTATDYYWPAVAGNIRKERVSWGRLARVLGREGADPKVSRSFYTAMTQQVLLFGAETWVLTRKMESALDTFQGRVARRLTGRQPRWWRDGKWFYPSLAGALNEAGVVRARTSVLQRQNTVAQFISARPIMGICEVEERQRGTRVPQRWWEQLELTGGWRGRRRQRRRQEQTRQRRRCQDLDRNRNRTQTICREGPRAAPGRRRPWGSVDPVGRSGMGRRIELTGGNLSKTM